MVKRKYSMPPSDMEILDKYILRAGGTPAWRLVQKSLVEQIIGMSGKPLGKITVDDLMRVRDQITESRFKPNYQRRLVLAMRRFFLWYGKQTGKDFTEIGTIKLPKGQWKCKKPEDMLSAQDVEVILRESRNSRDRAFLAMLWDGSNRPIELLSLNWQDLKSDEYGYSFKTSAKTGKERHIRLTISIPYLEAWRRDYPGNAKGENPVFVSVKRPHAKWTMMAAKAMIKELRKITGLENLKLSIFRPSRITHDVKSGYDLPFLMMKNWGNMKTPMIDLYTNIGMDYIDQTALRKAGMERVEKAKETEQYKLEVPICPKCRTLNIQGSLFCAVCRTPLSEVAEQKLTTMNSTLDAELTEADYVEAAREMYARRKTRV